MSLVSLLLLLLLAASGALTAPAQRSALAQLGQSAYNYLPPEVKLSQPPAITTSAAVVETQAPVTEAPPPSAAPTSSGYAYRTVRRLKYRRQRVRRDVSHLAMAQYLPPRETYLPPGPAAMALSDDTVEVNAAMPEDALRVYLPPEAETEVPNEADTAAPLEADEEAATATPAATLPKEAEAEPQDTASLAADGYHYKRPAEEMPMPGEYLPPLQKEQTVAEGPAEGAVLSADGYHYRTIRRLKF